ncbi:MAG: 3'-5' exonuclease, partial [Myxococcota bacterium]
LNGVDFDDLLVLPLKIFHGHHDVLRKVRDRYRYIMVDEYQDTNAVQLLLLRVMGAPRNNVCVVGDDDQSIYAFRGAVFKNILEFERHFSGARVIKLEQNYRSTSRILTAANAVIRHNKHRRKKTLWSALGSGEQLRYLELADEHEEATFIAGDIMRERLTRKRPWSDFAILFRTATLSRHLEEALGDEHIPYRLQGGTEFFDRREVKDLTAYLRVIINPADEMGLRRSLNIPSRGLGHTTLGRLSTFAEEHKLPLYRALIRAREIEGVGPAQRKAIEDYLDLIHHFQQRFKATRMSIAFEELLKRLDYRSWLTRGEKSEKVARIRLEHIDEIVSSLAAFQDRGGTLAAYVSRLALRDAPRQEQEQEGNEVTLMTLHASKGLEFPCVYMVGFEEELLPHARSMEVGADGDLEEERRLAYVGITRARQQLVLTSTHQRGRGHAKKRRHPSRFLHEIPDDVIRINRHGEPDDIEDTKETGRAFLKLIHAALE